MSKMKDPSGLLSQFQKLLDQGFELDSDAIVDNYLVMKDVINNGNRYSIAKIVDKNVQALAILGECDPINGVACYQLGYAVRTEFRNRGLAKEASERAIKELKNDLAKMNVHYFYVEAVVDRKNESSLKVAEKILSTNKIMILDEHTKIPAYFFHRQFDTSIASIEI